MSLKLRLRSGLLRLVVSERFLKVRRQLAELRRRLTGRAHTVSVFLELDDPYSYLLCHYLPELKEYYDIELKLYLSDAVTGAMRPAPDLYPEYVLRDCERLATELGIPFLDKGTTPPVEHRRALLDALASREASTDFYEELIQGITAYWRGDTESVARRAEVSNAAGGSELMLARNQELLQKLGHYNSAMLHYGREWYWGVDRLHYLIARLETSGLARKSGTTPPRLASIRQVMQLDLPVRPPAAAKDLPPLELFHSFRSPYSYLSLQRIFEIADAFGVEVILRPVMPMVMRGMRVPRQKLAYIVFDASREARARGIPFGKVADPLGIGVERCQAVLQYAISERRGREFLINAGRAIWAQGIDVATDEGLRVVASATGLFWPDVLTSLGDEEWRSITRANRASMMESGSWGVPTVRIGEFVTWGQDRDWLIVRQLEELCESGEGILI